MLSGSVPPAAAHFFFMKTTHPRFLSLGTTPCAAATSLPKTVCFRESTVSYLFIITCDDG